MKLRVLQNTSLDLAQYRPLAYLNISPQLLRLLVHFVQRV